MSKECHICKNHTIFYVWSTSRYFPKKALVKYMNTKSKYERNRIFKEGVPICFSCKDKLKEYENSSKQ